MRRGWTAGLMAMAVLVLAQPAHAVSRTRFDVPTVRGETVRVSQTTSKRALSRRHRRVIVLVPGTIGTSEHLYEPPFAGYDATAILARAGYIAVTMDLPGFGASTGPPDGGAATSTGRPAQAPARCSTSPGGRSSCGR